MGYELQMNFVGYDSNVFCVYLFLNSHVFALFVGLFLLSRVQLHAICMLVSQLVNIATHCIII